MTICVHCGLPPERGCEDHVQRVPRRKKAAKVERVQTSQSIHPRVRNGHTVHAKVNTAKAQHS